MTSDLSRQAFASGLEPVAAPAGDRLGAVAIRGLGAVGGFGCGRAELLQAWRNPPGPNGKVEVVGSAGARSVPAFLADSGPLDEVVPRRKLRRVDRFSRLVTLAAHLALADGDALDFDRGRLGVVMATGYGANHTTFRFLDDCLDYGAAAASPLLFSGAGHSGALSNLTILLEITGPLLTVCQPTMPIASALATAICWLREGRAEAVLVGGAEEYVPLLGYARERARPDKGEALSAVGEGAAFLLLTPTAGRRTEPGLDLLLHYPGESAGETIQFPDNSPVLGNQTRCGRESAAWRKARQEHKAGWLDTGVLFGDLPTALIFNLTLAAALWANSGEGAKHPYLHCVETGQDGGWVRATVGQFSGLR